MSSRPPDPLNDTLEHPVPKKAPPGGGRAQATVVVVQGSDADLGAHARVETRVVIGRESRSALSLADPGVSKQHAAIEAVEGLGGRVSYHLHDLGSTNGTLVNGAKVKRPRKLKDGDKITVAGTVLRFMVGDSIDAAFLAQVDAMLSTDELTGLLARRRFDASLDEALRTAQANGTKVALLVLDVDGLKAINDAHGHAMGAFTIAQVGRLLAEVVGRQGVATRFGGDEFVAFLPGLDRAAGVAVAEALRARVAAHRFSREGVTVGATLSIGVAVFPDRARSAQALFEAADRALYRAKAAGKNQVVS